MKANGRCVMFDTRKCLLLSILFVGCLVLVGTTQGKDFEYTGFLTLDYSKLGEDPDFKGALSWKAKDASFCDYDKVPLERIVFHPHGGKIGSCPVATDRRFRPEFWFWNPNANFRLVQNSRAEKHWVGGVCQGPAARLV